MPWQELWKARLKNRVYSVDTNIFIDWWDRLYPPDIFISLKERFEALIHEVKLFAPKLVLTEIERVGSRELKSWAKAHSTIFLPNDESIQSEASKIINGFPIIDPDAQYQEADSFVIALAKSRGFTVVTHETSFKLKTRSKRPPYSERVYIPDVCSKLDIPCIELIELMRREGWTF